MSDEDVYRVLEGVVPECDNGAFPRPDPTMVSTGYGLGGVPIRDLFPSRPVDRGGFTFVRSLDFSAVRPLTRTGRVLARVRRVRRWWRAHWWPAVIRDLRAELRRADEWDREWHG